MPTKTQTKIAVTLILGSLLMTVFASSASIAKAYAQTSDNISGQYVDTQARFQMDLPQGWSGTKVLGLYPIVSPTGFDVSKVSSMPEAIMMIMIFNRFDARDEALSGDFTNFIDQSETSSDNSGAQGHCHATAGEIVKVNDLTAYHAVHQCDTNSFGIYKANTYALITGTKFIMVTYAATSAAAYDKYLADFEHSFSSVKANDALNFRTTLPYVLAASKEYSQSVHALGKDWTLKIQTSSSLSNFDFAESEKKITFRVEGLSGTKGVILVPLQGLLVGPYDVKIDGKPTDQFTIIDDKTTGEKVLQLGYTHSAHDVEISGGTVVPEFPLYLIALLGGVIGIITILGRMAKLPISRQ